MSLAPIVSVALLAAALAFAWFRSLTYLHIFQQEEYDGSRFLPWLVRTRSFDRTLSAVLAVLGLAELLVAGGPSPAFAGAAALAFAFFAAREPARLKASKKKLVMTSRAKRVVGGAFALTAVVVVVCALTAMPVPVWVLVVQAVPLTLVLSNLALTPVERSIQNRYWTEAHEKLTRLAPTVIGVTGSFGKTSVKHILGHILEMAAPTLITPGSINTPMGISRIVRERLTPRHRYFVVEMGAYGPGSIARLCRLAPPDTAVVTAIGMAHYERFKTLDAVAETKFELADAAVARGGKVIVPDQVLEFAHTRAFAGRHPDSMIVCGAGTGPGPGSGPDALTITAIRQEAEGTVVEVLWRGTPHTLRAPIYGAHHGTNIALAFATACALGMEPETVVTALRTTPQIAHRLEVKRPGDGSIIIDDAYNSNPIGFAGALPLLTLLRRAGGRRILVTPGMVELGAAHESEHARLGTLAAEHVDVLLPVRPERIPTFVDAFRTAAPAAAVHACATFAEAQDWMRANVAAGDVVLLENDLPDLYERKLVL
ncbi:Mur ligase family protein [Azospirillum halopraeferens]|uniref:Mur ligase family protein n=1 Tax=Azospirillum halopraeferens TaxID=34010 RepID=UPI000406FB5B|nr:UDP-N-acetylmuramoyl-tripeptide--D-alanyl-D-alanine ligase [Azospirillum halopraeferens]